MNSYLLILSKSTLCLSLLYLAFSVLMRKETFFKLNRMVLLLMVLSSALIPFIHSPQLIQPFRQVKLETVFQRHTILEEPIQKNDFTSAIQLPAPAFETVKPVNWTAKNILLFIYLSGVLVSILLLLYSIVSILLLFRKARKTNHKGFHLMIVTDDIPAFSFGPYILISQHDYDSNSEAIITHELSHIRLCHFYDLMLMELAKIIFWFNPLVYRIVSDLKEIHEFQADDYTLTSGIDATKYQLLIIQKCVGHQKFALANSFNYCRIKNRITMMNKQKTSKAWRWKVATFLPLLALLLMAFGKSGEIIPIEIAPSAIESPSILGTWKLVSYNYSGDDELQPVAMQNVRIKLITETHFSWNQYMGTDKTVINSAGGSYVLSGDSYTENIEYGGQGMAGYIGKVQKFKVKIENDKMELSGELSSGLKIKEVWEKYKPSDQTTMIPPPPPPLNKDKHMIWLENDGSVRYNNVQTTFDGLTEKIKSGLNENPQSQFNIYIEEGKIDEQIDKIKEILKANGNPKVQFWSFYVEKGTDSKGQLSSKVYSKTMDVK